MTLERNRISNDVAGFCLGEMPAYVEVVADSDLNGSELRCQFHGTVAFRRGPGETASAGKYEREAMFPAVANGRQYHHIRWNVFMTPLRATRQIG